MLSPDQQVLQDLQKKDNQILELGCGQKKIDYAIGLDIQTHSCVDLVSDLNRPLPFRDGIFDLVYADQVLEHIQNLVDLVYEVLRVLKPGGVLVAKVPYFRSSWAHIDPTHVRSFTINTLDYFVLENYFHQEYRFREGGFKSLQVYLEMDGKPGWLSRRLSALALRYPSRFENSFLSFVAPFHQITYILTK